MVQIAAARYFRTIKHPLGEGLLIKIEPSFMDKNQAEKFRTKILGWKEGVEVEEISKEEYDSETEEDYDE